MRRRLVLGLTPLLALVGAFRWGDRAQADGAPATSTVIGVVRTTGGPGSAHVVAVRRTDVDWVGEARVGLGGLLCMSALLAPPGGRVEFRIVAGLRTGVAGRFRIDGLAPGHYRLCATTPAGGVGAVDLWIPVGGAVIEKDILIGVPARTVVWGRARYADGRAFRGRIAPFPIGMVVVAGAPGVETDACGRFRLPLDLPPSGLRGLWIGAVVPGRSVVLWTLYARRGPLDLVVDAGVRTVWGTVVEEGSGHPIVGAEAILCGWGDARGMQQVERAVTDGKGRFRLTLVGPGPRTVLVRSERHGEAWGDVPERAAHVILPPLRRPGRVRGRVVWPDGASHRGGLRVWVWSGLDDERGGPGAAVTTPDATGRFDLGPLRPGRVMAYAAGGGWLSGAIPNYVDGQEEALGPVSVGAGETVELELPVVPAGTVRGRVTRPGGTPVAGALVRVRIDHGTGQALGMPPPGTGDEPLYAATDVGGTYTLAALIPGLPYSVEVEAVGLATVSSGVVRVGSGEARTVDLQLGPMRPLAVSVRDQATGRPVAGASVHLDHFLRTGSVAHGGACTTDRCGRCTFERPRAEPMEVVVFAKGYRRAARFIDAEGTGPLAPVAFWLSR